MCGVKRSTSRPTQSCASPPQISTRVATPPASSSGTFCASRSSTIFGSAMVNRLKVVPEARAITMNRPNMTTASRGVSDTAGFETRLLA